MADVVIHPKPNGSYHVKGPFTLVLGDGTELRIEDQAWLCRCGQSGTKPFCDGTHKTAGFCCADADMRPHVEARRG